LQGSDGQLLAGIAFRLLRDAQEVLLRLGDGARLPGNRDHGLQAQAAIDLIALILDDMVAESLWPLLGLVVTLKIRKTASLAAVRRPPCTAERRRPGTILAPLHRVEHRV